MYLLQGKILPIGKSFEADGVLYSANWLEKSSSTEREALGITEYTPPSNFIRPDDRLYWVSQNENGSYESAPKDILIVRERFLEEAHKAAADIIAKTDSLITEAKEINYPIAVNLGFTRKLVRESLLKITAEIKDESNTAAIFEKYQNHVWPSIYKEIHVSQTDESNTEIVTEYLVINDSNTKKLITNTDAEFTFIQTNIEDGRFIAFSNRTDLDQTKEDKVKVLWTEFERRFENSTVQVSIEAANNVTYTFGCDRETRDNIMGVNTGIAIGLPIPNPRLWTPQGASIPINVSHDDLKNIGAAILNKKDELINIYFFHKAMVMSANNLADVINYDYSTGWV